MPLRIEGFVLITASLARSAAFYTKALGFEFIEDRQRAGGVEAILRLGETRLVLIEPDRPAASYPQPRAANDPWFQHFALAVSDAKAAFDQISRHGYEPISTQPPIRLPESSGSVTAWKFRDPDGHPLEISEFPKGRWAARPTDTLFLGVDHTAMAVQNLAASIRFYRSLGLVEAQRLVNEGSTQAALDGLDNPVVDIVVMVLEGEGPHLELLHYRNPRSGQARRFDATDVTATKTIIAGLAHPSLADPDGHELLPGEHLD